MINIKNKKYNAELIEFIMLGVVLFVVSFVLIEFKAKEIYNSSDNSKNTYINFDKDTKSVSKQLNSQLKTSNLMTINNNKTPDIADDDVINFNTTYYSLLLPYNLNYYTDKFNASKTSSELLIAVKQLYSQIYRNNLIKSVDIIASFESMITNMSELIVLEDKIYSEIALNTGNTDTDDSKNKMFIEEIIQQKSEYIKIIKKENENISKSLQSNDSGASYEAIILLNRINDCFVLLSSRATSDYNFYILNMGYDTKSNPKIILFNPVEKASSDINTFINSN